MKYPQRGRGTTSGGSGPISVTLDGETATLAITSPIASGTAINIQSSGAGYTKSGDSIVLPASASLFNNAGEIEIERNGQDLIRGTDVLWSSSTQVSFPFDLEVNDLISITNLEVNS